MTQRLKDRSRQRKIKSSYEVYPIAAERFRLLVKGAGSLHVIRPVRREETKKISLPSGIKHQSLELRFGSEL